MIAWTKLILYGTVIGVSNVIPGVSGGTIAVILNVYDKLIGAISNINTEFKKSMQFLLPFFVGMGIGIFAFSHIISYTFIYYNMQTNFFLMGLILGSAPMLLKRSLNKGFSFSIMVVCAFFSIVVLLSVFCMTNDSFVHITDINVQNFFILFFSGILASIAMIIPGISGSFIMLLLGTYESTLDAVSTFNISVLLPVLLGAIIGILIGSRLISMLFKRMPEHTYSAILGLVVTSCVAVYPGFSFSTVGIFSIILFILGLCSSSWFCSDKRSYISISRKKPH